MLLALLTNPPLWACVAAGAIYWAGTSVPIRVASSAAAARRARQRRALWFATGLVVVAAALSPPMDDWSDHWFWVHMTQHLLLVVVAAPLIAIGAPWLAVWRVVGHRARVTLTRTVSHGRAWAPVRASVRPFGRPWGAWLAFNATLLGWHLPVLYNLTLRNAFVHDLEHGLMLVTALLFWVQVVESPPLHVRLSYPGQLGYLMAATIAGWLLALALSLPATSSYAAYASQHHGGPGLSAAVDQQLAAGVMWVPGSIPYGIAILVLLYRWLDQRTSSERDVPTGRALVEERQ